MTWNVNIVLIFTGGILQFIGFSRTCLITENATKADCSYLDLTGIPTNLPKTLLEIDLTGNCIQVLYNNSFQELKNLKKLALDFNKLSILEPGCFFGLGDLINLSMTGNELSLHGNSYPADVFEPVKNLATLKISDNTRNPPVQPFQYPDVFRYMDGLKTISIDLYPVPVFGSVFNNLRELEVVDFKNCFLKRIQNDTFNGIPTSITALYLRNCKEIDKGVGNMTFKRFKNLKTLDISETMMSFPTAIELLCGLANNTMEVINFNNVNEPNLIPKGLQYSVILTEENTRCLRRICVEHLNIANNAIVEVHRNSLFNMEHPMCLRSIDFSRNSFHIKSDYLDVDVVLLFMNAKNLETIDYSYVPLEFPVSSNPVEKSLSYLNTASEESIFPIPCPPKLREIRLTHILTNFGFVHNFTLMNCDSITFIDVSYTSFHKLTFYFDGFENTKILNVSGIDFSSSKPLFLDYFTYLNTLVMSNTNLDSVFYKLKLYDIFDPLKNIKHLDISQNHLSVISKRVFQKTTHIKSLNVSNNLLTGIPSGVMGLENLTLLDLSENRIIGLTAFETNWLDNLLRRNKAITLYLRGNTLSCTCAHEKFIQWIFTTQVELDNNRNYTCVMQNGKYGNTQYVKAHYKEIFNACVSYFWLIFSLCLVFSFVVVIAGSVVGYRYRRNIRFFCMTRCRDDGQYIALEDDSSYTYDAFVCYCAEDYSWIYHDLRKEMELNRSLSLCFHDRDFDIGKRIDQNIIDRMKESKHVLFDLTPEYREGNYFDMETFICKQIMFERSNPYGIILIFRNGMKADQAKGFFKNQWNTVTCIEWPNESDSNNDEITHLWNRIYLAIKGPSSGAVSDGGAPNARPL